MTSDSRHAKRVVIRDLLIFQVKLLLDGVKDVVLMPASIVAAGLDVVFPGPQPGRLFYQVLRAGERFDRWLSLFSAGERAQQEREGLFGASRAGADTLLGEIEKLVIGREEPRAGGRMR